MHMFLSYRYMYYTHSTMYTPTLSHPRNNQLICWYQRILQRQFMNPQRDKLSGFKLHKSVHVMKITVRKNTVQTTQHGTKFLDTFVCYVDT